MTVTFKSNLEPTPEATAEQGPRRERVILCTNVLPVLLNRDPQTGTWSAEYDRQNLYEDGPMYVSLRDMDRDVYHVGVPQAFVPMSEREEVEALLLEMNCFPVFCDAKRAHNYFQGYCKGILWPVFHNVIDLYSRIDPQRALKSNAADEPGGRKLHQQQEHQAEEDWEPTQSYSPMEAAACWPDYCAINGMFARKVVEHYSEGDLLWIHDYHLLLLPSYLLRRLPNPTIGLFLHVPFPSSEIFRTLATREEVLRAMLCADHIGFDLYEYARHFLTCCSRMLGLSYEPKRGGVLAIKNHGREVAVTCCHIGLDVAYVKQQLESHDMQAMATQVASTLVVTNGQLADAAGGKALVARLAAAPSGRGSDRRQMILSIDEVEGLRGFGLRLLALDRLFVDYAYLRGRVVLKQIGLKLDSRPDDYLQCRNEIVGLVKQLKAKWGEDVIEYDERRHISLQERLALMQNADVYLSTAVRVGVDMTPFEYLMARRNLAGCLVLSEFSACSRVLQGSLRVNPFKTSALAATIEEALSMGLPERTARCARDLEYIERNTLNAWAERIIFDMKHSHSDAGEPLTKFGGGLAMRVVSAGASGQSAQRELDEMEICETFKHSKRRLILIDYSGTLVETSSMDMYMKRGGTARSWHYENGGSRRPGGSLETRDPITDTARGRLIDLARDSRNTVVIVSSDLRDELDHALEGIPNLALIAENGFVFRLGPDSPWISAVDEEEPTGGDWYGGSSTAGYYDAGNDEDESSSDAASMPDELPAMASGASSTRWVDAIMRIMFNYANRTNGSFVWESPSAVSFNYTLSDPDLGNLQAKNLQVELEQETVGQPLTVESGKGSVTVRLKGVNRGTAVRELIAHLNSHPIRASDFGDAVRPVDFVACFGDDVEDEKMFQVTNKYRPNQPDIHRFTVRVGKPTITKAKYILHDPDDVIDLLDALCKVSTSGKVRRNFSAGDFSKDGGLGSFITKRSYTAFPLQTDVCAIDSEADKCAVGPSGHGPVRTPISSPVSGDGETVPSPTVAGMGIPTVPSVTYIPSQEEMSSLFANQPPPDLFMGGVGPPGNGVDADPRAFPPTSPMRELDDHGSFASSDEFDMDNDEQTNAGGGGGGSSQVGALGNHIGSGHHHDNDGDDGDDATDAEREDVVSPMRSLSGGSSYNGFNRSSSEAVEAAFHQTVFGENQDTSTSAKREHLFKEFGGHNSANGKVHNNHGGADSSFPSVARPLIDPELVRLTVVALCSAGITFVLMKK